MVPMSSAKIEFREVPRTVLELMLEQMAQDNLSTMSWLEQSIKGAILQSLWRDLLQSDVFSLAIERVGFCCFVSFFFLIKLRFVLKVLDPTRYEAARYQRQTAWPWQDFLEKIPLPCHSDTALSFNLSIGLLKENLGIFFSRNVKDTLPNGITLVWVMWSKFHSFGGRRQSVLL